MSTVSAFVSGWNTPCMIECEYLAPPHIEQGTRLAMALYVIWDAMLELLDPAAAVPSVPTHTEAGLAQRSTLLDPAPAMPSVPVPAHNESNKFPGGLPALEPEAQPAPALSELSTGGLPAPEPEDQPELSTHPTHILILMMAHANFDGRLPRAALISVDKGLQQKQAIWEDCDDCWSGLPSAMDVPTMPQGLAKDSAAEVLRSLRHLARTAWPEPHAAVLAAAASGSAIEPASYADWEVLQGEMLATANASVAAQGAIGVPQRPATPAAAAVATAAQGAMGGLLPSFSSCGWGEALWCFNPACTNLEGPSELALKTLPCGRGCGVRYCSPECQAQGWRDGHRLSCGRLRERKLARLGEFHQS